MKKLFIFVCTLLIAGVFVSNALAAGTVTVTTSSYMLGDSRIKTITFTCVGDNSDGTVPDTAFNADEFVNGYYLYNVETDPGATAPDAADVLIKNAGGRDLLDGGGTDLLHATATQSMSGSIPFFELIDGALTFDVDNQATVDATYTVKLTFVQ